MIGENGRVVEAIPAENVHPTPQTRFEIDPQTLIDTHRAMRGSTRQVLGYYHSHPNGRSHPSQTDRELAAGDGKIWAIIAPGKTTWWRDAADGFRPLSLALTEG